MERRTFLKTGALAAAATSIAMPAIAQSMPEVKWRLTSSFPKQLDTIFGTAQQFAKFMSDATDGRFQVQTFSAGEIVPGLQALDAVSSGTVECAHTPTYFYIGKEPAFGLGTGIPFGLNARQQHSWWYFGGGEQIINEALAKFNAYAIPCGNSGCQMGGFFRKELKTVDDLKGLKFRIGGMGGSVLAKLGVVPTQIAPGDVYPALERGTIDAAEFVGPYDDEKLGFVKVAPYYYYPGWWEGGAMLHLVMNQEQWNKLPKHYQAMVYHACEAANNWMLAKYDAVNPGGLRRLVGQGAQLRAFPQPIMEASLKAAEEYYAETSAKSELFKKGYESMVAFRGENLLWWQVAELSYDAFMNRLKSR
ncbi:MAG: TRAP transporter substrate-binding protein DctP [Bosea sp.]|jgi:TRAP-type mannitol/chloroaromatic compound transport system substrate-binding protein|uniref:TRAP transporter substrate-binding protein n=1 Tax=Bosea sp. (in: a-proteobacteria) TaxID=1871050 RepID=UPI00086E4B0A|nr:TRAP transporter substrate-binding protein DctP [Bosea sp. (in: a-proteobacteria)]MBN9447476.1 TRAP transporter substrate-binding protein DctP [Bosea sp. (in: a-proteobacteria)]MBN9472050.1 TRAP transporter substrate-binding protein DctP [Bosea sp. (in: a-proteobacteria)]ODT45996.1 MAG: ABC transporter substrate-binding protein [Methylobacterium sp. SCN 67-24]